MPRRRPETRARRAAGTWQRLAVPDDLFTALADRYDALHAERFTPEHLDADVDLLAALAGGGPALELAIGTGRVALPLAARGIEVRGIDLSPGMVAELRAKPGGDAIPVAVGDMATTRVPGEFSLVYLVFSTIGNLLTQDEQVACFENAARHLRPGGCFVVEIGVPGLRRLPPGSTAFVFAVAPGYVGVDEYDVATQRLWSRHHRTAADGRCDLVVTPQRYVWPSELDLMARLAGLRLCDRWADWHRSPFTSESGAHVSVWEKPLGA